MNLPIYFTFFMTFCTIPLIIFNHWPFWNSPIQWEVLTYFQCIPFWVTGREAVFQKNAINTGRQFLFMHQISTNVLWNLNLAMKMLTAGTLMDLTLVLVKRGTVETAPYAKVM